VKSKGVVEKTTAQENSEFFKSRTLESRVCTFYSKQSQEFSEDEKEAYERRVNEAITSNSFAKAVPEDWGGYQIYPNRISFLHTEWENPTFTDLIYENHRQGHWHMGNIY